MNLSSSNHLSMNESNTYVTFEDVNQVTYNRLVEAIEELKMLFEGSIEIYISNKAAYVNAFVKEFEEDGLESMHIPKNLEMSKPKIQKYTQSQMEQILQAGK
jgi:hypothetical protein